APAVPAWAGGGSIGTCSRLLASAVIAPGGRDLGTLNGFLDVACSLGIFLRTLSSRLMQGSGNIARFGLGRLQDLARTTEHLWQCGGFGFGRLTGPFPLFFTLQDPQ